MQYGKVEICGVNTSELKVLSEERKRELMKIIRSGDKRAAKRARDEMIEGNLRLVLSVIHRFRNRGEELDDLFQVGVIGLIKAIDNFDPSLDVRFSTYGVPMILGELRRYLRDNNSVRVSRSMRDTAYKAMQIKELLTAENNREPGVDEIARRMGVPREDVVLALEAIVEPVSLYEPVFSDNEAGDAGGYFSRMLAAAQTFPNRYCKIMSELYGIIGFLIDNAAPENRLTTTMPEFYLMRALDFIDRNYYESITMEDIAASVGVSRKTLTTVFSDLTGFSPKDYLIYYRISKSIDLLRDQNLSIEMIAASTGYNDQFYFSKQFKQNVGMTPSECRKRMAADPSWRFQSPIDRVRQQYSEPSANEKPPQF